MRRYASMTLTNLTFGHGPNKALLCTIRPLLVVLAHQLASPNDDLRQVRAEEFSFYRVCTDGDEVCMAR